MTVSIATLNVDRAGASKFPDTFDFMQQFPADAFSLQQIDISELEGAKVHHSMEAGGGSGFSLQARSSHQPAASGLGHDFAWPRPSTCRLTRWLLLGLRRRLSRCSQVASPCIWCWVPSMASRTMGRARIRWCRSSSQSSGPLRCRFLLFGDFNWQRGEGGALDNLISTGQLRSLDDAFHGVLPATSPTRARRIDFAVAHPAIAATAIEHMEGPGDHVAVAYT